MNLKALLDIEPANKPLFSVGDVVYIMTPVGKITLKGRIVEQRLNDILQKWFYRISVPEYGEQIILRRENDLKSYPAAFKT